MYQFGAGRGIKEFVDFKNILFDTIKNLQITRKRYLEECMDLDDYNRGIQKKRKVTQ